MLILTRKVGEEIVLPDCGVTIGVVKIMGKTVRLGIAAPAEVPVNRQEIEDKIRETERLSQSPRSTGAAAGNTFPHACPRRGLSQELAEWITQRTGGRVRGLRVAEENGRIVVSGKVPSYYARQLVCAAVLDALPTLGTEDPNEVEFALDVEPSFRRAPR
jgi:carbon storage regulator